MTVELESLAKKIEDGIRTQGRYYVTCPAEMAQLAPLGRALELAQQNRWMLVSHLGGAHYEFFEATPSPRQQLF